MKRILIGLLFFASAAAGQSKQDIAWVPNSDNAKNLARQSCKPMLFEAWATWCGPCKQMDREVWPDKRVVEASRKFVAVSYEVKAVGESLPVFYRLNVIPTIVVADPWGEVLTAQEGLIPVKDLTAILSEIPADFTPVREAREALEKDRSNGTALAKVGRFYETNKAFALANRYYGEALRSPLANESARMREDLRWWSSMNELRMHRWSDAKKSVERFLDEFPQSASRDQALLALVVANVRRGKRSEAEKRFSELKAQFPKSDAISSAEQVLGQ